MVAKFYKICCSAFVLCIASYNGIAQLNIQPRKTALQLAQALTGNGVVVSNASLNCADNSNGIFNSPNALLGIDSGIVLSTGNVTQMRGAEPGATSSNMNRSGDAQLTAISGTNVTYDACVLEFDVVPHGDELKFDYLFASEEYINAVCGPFNDVFAFFISGPGITGQKNIALVPNTQIPVAVNSVNDGIVGSYTGSNMRYCTGMGAGSPFTQYYINNANSSNFAYRGYTTVFTAKQTVQPCQKYRLKLAIADAGNRLYDSGVLIKSGSLSSTTIEGLVDAPVNFMGEKAIVRGCGSATVTVARSESRSIVQNVNLTYGGNAILGVDVATLPNAIQIASNAINTTFDVQALIANTDNTEKELKIFLHNVNNCTNISEMVDTLTIKILPAPEVNIIEHNIYTCKGKAVTINTTTNTNLVSYLWSPNAAINNIRVAQPIVNPDTTTIYTLTYNIDQSGCAPKIDRVTVHVIEGPEEIRFSDDSLTVCKDAGIEVGATVVPQLGGLDYSWTGPGNYTSNASVLTRNNMQALHEGWYKLEVTSSDCGSITDSMYVNIIDFVPLPNVPTPQQACLDLAYTLKTSQTESLKWYDANGNFINTPTPTHLGEVLGTYTYYATQMLGTCESEKLAVDVNVLKCCEQDMFIPNAFTPNGDGTNDTYKFIIDDGTRLINFEVYNRWGQRVFVQSGGSEVNWDGATNMRVNDVGVYYYTMLATCADGRTVERKGEIHLLK